MVTLLLVHIFYDGASAAGTVGPSNDYASTAPPVGAFAFISGYGASAGGSNGVRRFNPPLMGGLDRGISGGLQG